METYDMNRYAVTNEQFKHTITTVIHTKGQVIEVGEPYFDDGEILVTFLEDDGTPAPTKSIAQVDCIGIDTSSVDQDAYAQLLRIYMDNGGVQNGTVRINGKTYDAYTVNPFRTRFVVTNNPGEFHGTAGNNGQQLSLPRRVRITYYAFQRNDFDTIDGNVGPQYTPALMLAVLKKLDELDSAINGGAKAGYSGGEYKMLKEDLTGHLRENYIGGGLLSTGETVYPQAEERVINVPAGEYLVHPYWGQFYRHDFAMVFNGQVLEEGTDYELVGMDPGRTSISQPNSGVFTFIRLRKAIVATEENPLKIRYHAFGGELTPETYERFHDYVMAFISSVTSGDILTASNIGNNASFRSLVERVANAEQLVGLYPTTNQLIKPSTAPGIRGYANRWVSVAYYTNPVWSNSVINFVSHVSSTFRLTFNIGNDRLFAARFCLNIDFKNMDVKVVPIMVNEYHFDEDVTTYKGQTVIPKFRILKGFYGSSQSEIGGYILQMCLSPLDISDINNVSYVANLYNETCQADHVWTMAPNADTEDAHAVIYGDTDWVGYQGSDYGRFDSHRSNVVCVTKTPFVVLRKDYLTATGEGGVLPKNFKDIQDFSFSEGTDEDNYPNGEITEGNGLTIDGAAPTVVVNDCLNACLTGIGVQIYDRLKQEATYHILDDITSIVTDGYKVNGFHGKEMFHLDDLCAVAVRKDPSQTISDIPRFYLKAAIGSQSAALERFVLLRVDYLLNGCQGLATAGYTVEGVTDEIAQSVQEEAAQIPLTLHRANTVENFAKL